MLDAEAAGSSSGSVYTNTRARGSVLRHVNVNVQDGVPRCAPAPAPAPVLLVACALVMVMCDGITPTLSAV